MAHPKRNLPTGWRVADDGLVLSQNMPEEHLKLIKDLELHPQDVIVAGYPKCGECEILYLGLSRCYRPNPDSWFFFLR